MKSRVITQFNPSTGEKIEDIPFTDENEIPDIFKNARVAQEKWEKVSFKQRKKYLVNMQKYLLKIKDKAAKIISDCVGKSLVEAIGTEVCPCISAFNYYINETPNILKKEKIKNRSPLFSNKYAYRVYEPVGVIGIISPWNYPFSIPFNEVIMGLMCGNACILKVASATVKIGKLIEEIVRASGLPDGLFYNIVCSGSEISDIMLKNKVDKIFFTGSVTIGKVITEQCSKSLTPIVLELGGNDPMVVLDDCDLERTTNGAIWGAFQNCGQTCAGIERCYVDKKISKKFIEMLSKKVNAMKFGVPSENHNIDHGSMTTKKQLDKVKEQVEDALKNGAKIVAQSKPIGDVSKGNFHPAMVLVDVTHDMELMLEETFGPLLPVFEFNTVDEAIKHANESQYTLTASVWSGSNSRGREVAEKLKAGVVTVNDHVYTHGCANLEWGGWKDTGQGRTHGEGGIKEMCNMKIIDYDKFPKCLSKRNLWWHEFNKDSYDSLAKGCEYEASGNFFSKMFLLLKLFPFYLKKISTKWKPWDEKKKESDSERTRLMDE